MHSLGEHHRKCMDTQHFPDQCFWVCAVVVWGFFSSSQQQCWSLVSDRLSCHFWDALGGEISSSCLPHLHLLTPSRGCVLQRGWASPDGAEPSSHCLQLPGHCWDNKLQSVLTGRRWQETAAHRGMALHPRSAFESSVLPEGSAGDGTAWCAGNDLEGGGPKHSAGCIASMLAVLRGLWNMLRCKTAVIRLQAIFSLFILCWCVMCSSVENLVSPKRRFELESRQGKHHLSRNHFS